MTVEFPNRMDYSYVFALIFCLPEQKEKAEIMLRDEVVSFANNMKIELDKLLTHI